jgi:hypothetical protein
VEEKNSFAWREGKLETVKTVKRREKKSLDAFILCPAQTSLPSREKHTFSDVSVCLSLIHFLSSLCG